MRNPGPQMWCWHSQSNPLSPTASRLAAQPSPHHWMRIMFRVGPVSLRERPQMKASTECIVNVNVILRNQTHTSNSGPRNAPLTDELSAGAACSAMAGIV